MDFEFHPANLGPNLGEYYEFMRKRVIHALLIPPNKFKLELALWNNYIDSFLLYAPRWYDPLLENDESSSLRSSFYTICRLTLLLIHRTIYGVDVSGGEKQLSLTQWLDCVLLFGRIQPRMVRELLGKVSGDLSTDCSRWIEFSLSMVDRIGHRLEKSASGKKHTRIREDILEIVSYLSDIVMLWSETGRIWPEVYALQMVLGVPQKLFLIDDQIIPIIDLIITEEDKETLGFDVKSKNIIRETIYRLLVDMMRWTCFEASSNGQQLIPSTQDQLVSHLFQALWQSLIEDRQLQDDFSVRRLCQEFDISALWSDYKSEKQNVLPIDEAQLDYMIGILQTFVPVDKATLGKSRTDHSIIRPAYVLVRRMISYHVAVVAF
jgi:hypothetical protein